MSRVNSSHEDELDESLWDSPSRPEATGKQTNSAKSTYQEQQERDQVLRQELQSVRQVNEAIEGVILSLRKAKDNMKTVNNTVSAASTLLNTWTRILSQTEHNQRLILNPSWPGASQDITDIEEEALEKQRVAERREVEEEERKRAAARRAEEDERRKVEVAAKPTKVPARGTARAGSAGRGTGASTPSSSYVQMGGPNASGTKRGSSTARRTTSGIGRGSAGRGARGRG
ncbi:hypothetical protein H2200_005298 [Cladophialophora chaetospira]|uniref:DASH complex subunit DUO1 n=1 Tax=Cladophialophora chaetospira TaxID=386627 RepID=A0AA38XBX2_9EURO|nr:hypothetical protein H2200_005298 [Cladophialophora chaetospira]